MCTFRVNCIRCIFCEFSFLILLFWFIEYISNRNVMKIKLKKSLCIFVVVLEPHLFIYHILFEFFFGCYFISTLSRDTQYLLIQFSFVIIMWAYFTQVLSMSTDDYRKASLFATGSFDQDFPIPDLIGNTEILTEEHR